MYICCVFYHLYEKKKLIYMQPDMGSLKLWKKNRRASWATPSISDIRFQYCFLQTFSTPLNEPKAITTEFNFHRKKMGNKNIFQTLNVREASTNHLIILCNEQFSQQNTTFCHYKLYKKFDRMSFEINLRHKYS